MRALILALSAATLILAGAAGARAGDRDDDHRHRGYHGYGSHHGYSHKPHIPHWFKAFVYPHSYGYYDRPKYKYWHGRKHKHGYKHGHAYKRRHVLPVPRIIRKLRHRHYYGFEKIVLKHDRYKVRAYDRRGRPVRLIVDAHSGRILKKRRYK